MFNGGDGFCVNGGGWVFVFMVVAGFCFGFHSYCFVLSWDFSAFFMIFMFATEYCGSSFYEGEIMNIMGLLSMKEKQQNVKEDQRSGVVGLKTNRNELLIVGERKDNI